MPKPTNFRFDEDVRGRHDGLQEHLSRLARRRYRSLNGELLAALDAWLDLHEEPWGGAVDGPAPEGDAVPANGVPTPAEQSLPPERPR